VAKAFLARREGVKEKKRGSNIYDDDNFHHADMHVYIHTYDLYPLMMR
jgi:hypothetical protein